MSAWDTDLGRWRLAWVEYLRARPPQVAPSDRGLYWRTETDEAGGFRLVPLHSLGPLIIDESDTTVGADEAFAREIALAHSAVDPHGMPMGLFSPDDIRAAVEGEVCDDERDADAAVGVMPAPLVVYADPVEVA